MKLKASLVVPLLAAALLVLGPDNGGFISGVWQGDANYDSDGKFSDCTMTAQAESGVLLGFVISKDYDWGLVLADENAKLRGGDDRGGRAARRRPRPDRGHRQSGRRAWHRHPAREHRPGARCAARG